MERNVISNEFNVEPLNDFASEEVFYIDFNRKKIVSLNQAETLGSTLLCLPYREELYPYGEAMRDYLLAGGLSVPSGMSEKGFLAENGMLEDFYYGFWPDEIAKRFSNWCESRNLEIKPIA